MKQQEKERVALYLRNLTFNEKEFYEEMFDHICSSFEARESKEQNVIQHIHQVIEPAFGGKAGLRKVQEAQARTRRQLIFKRALHLFGSYLFRWPTVVVTGLLFLLLFQLNQLFDQSKVFETSVTLALLIPFFLSHFGKWRFKQNCKRHRLPYRESQVNDTIHSLSIAGVALLFGLFVLVNRFIFGNTRGFIEFFSQYPVSFLPVSVLLLVYTLVCLQLFKEKFQVKLA